MNRRLLSLCAALGIAACTPSGTGSVVSGTGSASSAAGLPTGTTAGTPSGTGSGTVTSAVEAPWEQIDIGRYQRILEDELYTSLGDDRGYGPEHDLALDNIVAELQAAGVAPTLQPFSHDNQTFHNAVAVLPGTGPGDRAIVVGAHFDSVNNPGADDNGTGTAMVLELAHVLGAHTFEQDLIFVLFDREEQGLVGSRAFVDSLAVEVDFALTADMIGQDHGGSAVDLFSTQASRGLVDGFGDAIGTYAPGLDPRPRTGNNYGFSDHQAFEEAGIEAFVIIEADYNLNVHYHTPTDAIDTAAGYIDYPYVERTLRAAAGFLADEAGWVEGA